jgi:demethoxyubiquinone hydroxylase (CLK1/Coq7/Cat5 family)
METVIEFLKKMASQHSLHLTKFEDSIATTEEIKTLLKTFMKEEGIDWGRTQGRNSNKIQDLGILSGSRKRNG